jgi:pilus assembly protein CpaE
MNTILVGCDVGVLPTLRQLLAARSLEILSVVPSLDAARTQAFPALDEDHLFVVQVPAGQDVSRLREFCSAVPGQPVLALLDPGTDLPRRLMAAMRAGAAQVVPLPLQADDFLEALDAILLQHARPAGPARVLAVCGVSGGSGATTIALNLAYELAQRRPGGCLLVELARQMGTVATYLDVEPASTTGDLLADASRLTLHGVRQAVVSPAPNFQVLAGPYRELAPAAFSSRNVLHLLDLCRRLSGLIVLDVPSTFDDLQFETLALADQVVLVGVQAVSSIRTLKMVRDTLEREEGIQGQQLVINRYDPNLPGFSAKRLAELLQVREVLTVADDYPAVMAALNHGKPLRQAVPHSRVVADVSALATALLGDQGAAAAPAEPGDRLARTMGAVPGRPPAPRLLRVLHVEDDVVQQHVLAHHLAAIKDFACSITCAASESQAVEAFRREHFDVVLLDYHLTQGNGLGCLRQIRRLDPLVPILAVSGLTTPHVAAELLEAGADDFLSKENLVGDSLARCLRAAVARADACKQRLPAAGGAAQVDAIFERVCKTFTAGSETDLLSCLQQLEEVQGASRFTAGQIQRLVDLVCSELEKSPGARRDGAPGLSRRVLLALFLRLFGGAPTPTAVGIGGDGV